MNDIEKKIEALKAEFLKKLEELQQEEPKPWKPQAREEYFFIDNYFLSHSFYNMGDDVDSYNFEIGNCFPTKERAEKVAKKMRLLLRLEQLHDMLCPDYVPDWNNEGELKFCLGRDCDDDCWVVDSFNVTQYPTAYFDTLENAEKALEILNKEMRESE